MNFYVKYKKLISIILCICIVFTMFFSAPQKTEAIVIADDILLYVAAALIAAGLTFATTQAIQDTATMTYTQAPTTVKDLIIEHVNNQINGIAVIGDTVWSWLQTYVYNNFTQGSNIITKTLNNNISWSGYPISPLLTTDYPYQCIFDEPGYTFLNLSKTKFYKLNNYLQVESGQFYVYKLENGVWNYLLTAYNMNYFGTNKILTATNCDIYTDATFTTVISNQNTDTLINISAAYTGDAVVDQPGYDYGTGDGVSKKRQVGFPPVLDDLVGKTKEDVQNPSGDIGQDIPVIDSTTSWWEQMLSRVLNPAFNPLVAVGEKIWEILKNTWEWMQGLIQALIDAIIPLVNSIIEAITGVTTAVNNANIDKSVETECNLNNFNFFDMIILILMFLFACIRLIGRVLFFVISLFGIPKDDWDINNNLLMGIDYLKNTLIPYINLSYWETMSWLLTFMFGFGIVRFVRKVSENG